ncbi:hypothetical protein D9M72_200260 [compost metagenome]
MTDVTLSDELREIAESYWDIVEKHGPDLYTRQTAVMPSGTVFWAGICNVLSTARLEKGRVHRTKFPWAYGQVGSLLDQTLGKAWRGDNNTLEPTRPRTLGEWEPRAWLCLFLANALEEGDIHG